MADVAARAELLCRHRAPSLDWCRRFRLLTTTRAETHIVKCTLYDIQTVKGMSALPAEVSSICSNCIDNDSIANSLCLGWGNVFLHADEHLFIPVNTCAYSCMSY
jgi:hypothetical protein